MFTRRPSTSCAAPRTGAAARSHARAARRRWEERAGRGGGATPRWTACARRSVSAQRTSRACTAARRPSRRAARKNAGTREKRASSSCTSRSRRTSQASTAASPPPNASAWSSARRTSRAAGARCRWWARSLLCRSTSLCWRSATSRTTAREDDAGPAHDELEDGARRRGLPDDAQGCLRRRGQRERRGPRGDGDGRRPPRRGSDPRVPRDAVALAPALNPHDGMIPHARKEPIS